jgi:hypothetical protein
MSQTRDVIKTCDFIVFISGLFRYVTRPTVLVEALCYKPEGRRFESRMRSIFSIYLTFQPHYGPGVDSASNRNEYQESSWG